MINPQETYGSNVNLRCAVYNGTSWVEVLGASTQLSSTRGGTVGIAGIASVDVGSVSINVLDVYDPAIATNTLLRPNRPIAVYVDSVSFATPRTDGAIFTGTIQDIQTNYFYEAGQQHVNITLYAVDAVSSHAGITVTNANGADGFNGTTLNGNANTAYGYQRWEDRINDLSTKFAKTTVPTVTISAPIPIYSI